MIGLQGTLCCGAECSGGTVEPSECRIVGCTLVDGCSSGCMPANAQRCHVEFTVHKVVIERELKAAPFLRWFVGYRPMLFVEITAPDGSVKKQRTRSGSLRVEEEQQGAGRTEVWMWGSSTGDAPGGAPLAFDTPTSVELQLRVFASHMGSTLLGEAEELLGEVRFRMDDDVRTGTWPLLRGSRICGSIGLGVCICSTKVKPETHRGPDLPRVAAVGLAAKGPEWKAEDVRLYPT